jgi:hypothetical protein
VPFNSEGGSRLLGMLLGAFLGFLFHAWVFWGKHYSWSVSLKSSFASLLFPLAIFSIIKFFISLGYSEDSIYGVVVICLLLVVIPVLLYFLIKIYINDSASKILNKRIEKSIEELNHHTEDENKR